MDLIAGYSLPNGLLNMNYNTRNRAGQPVQPSTDTITNAITQGLLPMLASAGIGTGAGISGQFGDAENLGRLAINKLGGNVNPNTTLPTQEGILSYLNSITPLKPYTDNTYTKIGANLLAPILDPTALITTARASKPVAKAVGEHAWNKTEDMMRQQGLMPNIVAYHGTPHEIQGGFDISKVGTGEGSQAYGHGMYFAESPDVSKSYMGKTVFNEPTLDKFTNGPNYYTDSSGKHFKVRDYIRNDKPVEVSSNEYNSKFKEVSDLYAKQNQGNLYKVDIPDAYIPTMMDYDKPLGQQSAIVKKALNDIKKQITPEMKMELGGDLNLLFGKDVTPVQFLNTMEIIHPTGGVGIGEKMLNEFGVKGIRYKDAMSRGADEGTSNFVVFDPKEVKILEKNSKKLGE